MSDFLLRNIRENIKLIFGNLHTLNEKIPVKLGEIPDLRGRWEVDKLGNIIPSRNPTTVSIGTSDRPIHSVFIANQSLHIMAPPNPDGSVQTIKFGMNKQNSLEIKEEKFESITAVENEDATAVDSKTNSQANFDKINIDSFYNLIFGSNEGDVDLTESVDSEGVEIARHTHQLGSNNISIGRNAGNSSQGLANDGSSSGHAIAIGVESGHSSQGYNSIAIGSRAGNTNQGDRSICIGAAAGENNTPRHSVIINTSNTPQNSTQEHTIVINSTNDQISTASSGLYIAPITQKTATDLNNTITPLYYNNTTKEIINTDGSALYTDITLTGTIKGPSEFILDPEGHGDNTGTIRIKGNLIVDGSQTVINSNIMTIEDNIISIRGSDTISSGIEIKSNETVIANLHYNGVEDMWETNNATINVGTGRILAGDISTDTVGKILALGTLQPGGVTDVHLNSLLINSNIETGIISAVLSNQEDRTGSTGMYLVSKMYDNFFYSVLLEKNTGNSNLSLLTETGVLTKTNTSGIPVAFEIKIISINKI
jgi:hypothetical protein